MRVDAFFPALAEVFDFEAVVFLLARRVVFSTFALDDSAVRRRVALAVPFFPADAASAFLAEVRRRDELDELRAFSVSL